MLALVLAPTGAPASAETPASAQSSGVSAMRAAVPCAPYCDKTTFRTANRLRGRGHGGWLATTLDSGGYGGRRWAEINRIPAGHGKFHVGIIHVPAGNAFRARSALSGARFAQRGTVFVLPLVTRNYTDGAAGPAYRRTAQWAARRLGAGWVVRAP